MNNAEAYQKACAMIDAKIGLYIHIAAYVVVNIIIITINFRLTPRYMWFQYPLIGWGTGLFLHTVGLFIFYGRIGLKEKMVKKEIEKISR